MILTLIISIITIVLMITSILFYPTIKIKKFQVNTYWIITSIGALLILICGLVPIKDFYQTLISKEEINMEIADGEADGLKTDGDVLDYIKANA